MTNKNNIFYFLIITLFILTSCGTDDPEKNGIKSGKLACKYYEINDEIDDIEEEADDLRDDQDDLDWDDDDDRIEFAELEKEVFSLNKKIMKLKIKKMKSSNGTRNRLISRSQGIFRNYKEE